MSANDYHNMPPFAGDSTVCGKPRCIVGGRPAPAHRGGAYLPACLPACPVPSVTAGKLRSLMALARRQKAVAWARGTVFTMINGPIAILNYFVQISFRLFKRRFSLFIPFTFTLAPISLSMPAKNSPPPPEESGEGGGKKKKKAICTMYIK